MHTRIATAALAAGMLLVAGAALGQSTKGRAAPASDQGELWEITMKMEMAGMPMAMPATTNRVCLGKEAGDDQYVPKNEDCRVTESRRTGNRHRYKMVCTGRNPMTAEGEITHANDAYQGRMRMTGKMDGEPMDMTQTFSGRKLGACTGTIQNQVAKAQADHAAQIADVCRQGVQSLTTELFFQPGAPCESQRGEFCGEVSKAAASARDPAGYTTLRKRNANLEPAFSACNQDLAGLAKAACSRAGETKNFEFIASGHCDDDVRRIGEASCRGRSFTSIEASMRGVCSRHATITRGQATATAAAPAPQAAPKAPDPVQQGLDAVRRLLPF